MTAWQPQTVRRIFAGLVPNDVAEAYERLLEADGVPQPDAADFFRDSDVADTLRSLGMATLYTPVPGRPPVLDPVDPDLAIRGVLHGLQVQIMEMQKLVTDGTRRAMDAHGLRRASRDSHLGEILTDREEISRVSASLINDATTDFMELDNLNRDIPSSVEWVVEGPEATADQVTHRVIYDQAYLQDPLGRKGIDAAMAAGHQARWRQVIHTKLQIADTSTALMALTVTGLDGAMLFRTEPAVRALRECFELQWDTAVPVTGPGRGSALTPEQRKVIALLAAGLSQDRIAERMGKGVATVRRHMTAIYRELGVTSIFQAGTEALRHGWVD